MEGELGLGLAVGGLDEDALGGLPARAGGAAGVRRDLVLAGDGAAELVGPRDEIEPRVRVLQPHLLRAPPRAVVLLALQDPRVPPVPLPLLDPPPLPSPWEAGLLGRGDSRLRSRTPPASR